MSRSPVTRALTGLVASISVVSLGAPVLAAPAAPAEPLRTWSSSVSTVCVESHVGKAWDVKGALRQWNRLKDGPTFVQESSCPDYEGTVTVRYESADNHFTGWTNWYWDESGHIVHADVTLNPQRIKAFDGQDRSCQRSHTTSHEFGHVLGLRHYPHSQSGATMSYLGWRERCGRLNAHDRSDFRELYPKAVPPGDLPA